MTLFLAPGRAAAGEAQTVEKWVEAKGLKVDEKDKNGATLAHLSAGEGRVDVLRWLQGRRVDVNAKDGSDRAPMHYAARGGHIEAMKWLKENGADMSAKDGRDETPMRKAEAAGRAEAAKWLKENGADANADGKSVGMAERPPPATLSGAAATTGRGAALKDQEIRRRLETVVLTEDYDSLTIGYFLDDVAALGRFNLIRNVDPDMLDTEVYLPVEGWTLRQALDKLRDLISGFSYTVRNEALVVTDGATAQSMYVRVYSLHEFHSNDPIRAVITGNSIDGAK